MKWLPSSPEAVETARRAVAANPQSSSAHHLLGHFLFGRGDYRGASAAFKKSEDLCIDWEKSEKVPRALNDAYFRSAIYRAVSRFCAGRYKEADRIASAVASVPLDKEYPLAPGTLLQIWEARNLPVRLMLANPDLPRQEYVLKASPAPLPKGLPGPEQRHDGHAHPVHGGQILPRSRVGRPPYPPGLTSSPASSVC